MAWQPSDFRFVWMLHWIFMTAIQIHMDLSSSSRDAHYDLRVLWPPWLRLVSMIFRLLHNSYILYILSLIAKTIWLYLDSTLHYFRVAIFIFFKTHNSRHLYTMLPWLYFNINIALTCRLEMTLNDYWTFLKNHP